MEIRQVIDAISIDIRDETEANITYERLAEQARALGHHKEADVLDCMAEDEKRHHDNLGIMRKSFSGQSVDLNELKKKSDCFTRGIQRMRY